MPHCLEEPEHARRPVAPNHSLHRSSAAWGTSAQRQWQRPLDQRRHGDVADSGNNTSPSPLLDIPRCHAYL